MTLQDGIRLLTLNGVLFDNRKRINDVRISLTSGSLRVSDLDSPLGSPLDLSDDSLSPQPPAPPPFSFELFARGSSNFSGVPPSTNILPPALPAQPTVQTSGQFVIQPPAPPPGFAPVRAPAPPQRFVPPQPPASPPGFAPVRAPAPPRDFVPAQPPAPLPSSSQFQAKPLSVGFSVEPQRSSRFFAQTAGAPAGKSADSQLSTGTAPQRKVFSLSSSLSLPVLSEADSSSSVSASGKVRKYVYIFFHF